MTLLLITIGTLISIFERLMTASTKEGFKFKLFIKKNWALFVLNVLTSLAIYLAVFSGETSPSWMIKSINFDAFNLVVLLTGAVSLYVWKLLIGIYKFLFDKVLKKIKLNTFN